jgi:hypothetical protein
MAVSSLIVIAVRFPGLYCATRWARGLVREHYHLSVLLHLGGFDAFDAFEIADVFQLARCSGCRQPKKTLYF